MLDFIKHCINKLADLFAKALKFETAHAKCLVK